MSVTKKEEKVTIHYRPDNAISVIYWSVTLFLICLCIIISCEVQAVTISAVLCGVVSAFLLFWPLYRRIVFGSSELLIYTLRPGKSVVCPYQNIISVKQQRDAFFITTKNQTWTIMLSKSKQSLFKEQLSKHGIQVD